MTRSKMVQFNMLLPRDIYKALKLYCRERNISVASFCRDAVSIRFNAMVQVESTTGAQTPESEKNDGSEKEII